ncbi:MAG: glycine--tRNA ligase [Candidatus Aenigmarchaeota archaeon]|nr:glycine--tRNA ligase [Candidatus Aenigmarchaeota archaeon]
MAVSDKVVELAKRRGFFTVSSEIYGGIAGFYDYGAYGTLLKRKLENLWRKYFVGMDENFFEIEASNIMPEKVFEGSGHITNFVDPVAKCKKCGTFHRADQIMEEFLHENFEGKTVEELTQLIKKHNVKCSRCKGELGDVSVLNMMFPLAMGAGKDTVAYLRPETAQGAYVNFLRHFNILRMRLPLGLAIIGKAFRNEISPRQLLLRQREFTQAELQIFFDPREVEEHDNWKEVAKYKLIIYHAKKMEKISCDDANKKMKIPKFYLYYLAKMQKFFLDELNIPEKKFRLRKLTDEEKAFYNKVHFDIEIQLEELGWKEVAGCHYRTDHDLKGHQLVSGQSQEIFYNEKKFIPHVLELSFGVDRILYSLLELNYAEDKDRVYLKLPAKLSPFTLAVFPLVNKDKIPKKAEEIFEELKKHFDAIYDDSGSIGKRYYRQDEISTPVTITCDYQTISENTVTIRDRDSTHQIRVNTKNLKTVLTKFLEGENLERLGKTVK